MRQTRHAAFDGGAVNDSGIRLQSAEAEHPYTRVTVRCDAHQMW